MKNNGQAREFMVKCLLHISSTMLFDIRDHISSFGVKRMNLSQLYYFQKLAEVQHYTRASEELYITQPALSHAISALEDELGTSLFQKDGRNMRLTEDGLAFKSQIDIALTAIDNAVAEVKSRHGLVSGTIKIGAMPTVSATYLPSAIKQYRDARGPLVEFLVYQGETVNLNQRLEKGVYDLVFTSPYQQTGMVSKVILHQELAVVAPVGHPLTKKDSVTFADLEGYDVVTYQKGIPVGKLLTKFLASHHANPEKIHLIRNYEDEVILGAMVAHEDVLALAMVTTNLIPQPGIAIIPLAEEGAKEFNPVSANRMSKAFLSLAAQDFINFLDEFEAPVYHHPLYPDTQE